MTHSSTPSSDEAGMKHVDASDLTSNKETFSVFSWSVVAKICQSI